MKSSTSGVYPRGVDSWDEAKREFKPYNGRLAFTYLNDLPFPTLLDRIGELPTHSDLKNRTDLDGSIHNLKTLVSDVHGLSHRLHSSQLEHLGLKAALTQVCAQISHTFGLGIDLQIDATPDRSARDLSLCFYRVAQEALNNIVKHSRSDTDCWHLARSQDYSGWNESSGVGFKVADAGMGLGLSAMRERVRSVGGRLTVTSGLGAGTLVVAEAPYHLGKRRAILQSLGLRLLLHSVEIAGVMLSSRRDQMLAYG